MASAKGTKLDPAGQWRREQYGISHVLVMDLQALLCAGTAINGPAVADKATKTGSF